MTAFAEANASVRHAEDPHPIPLPGDTFEGGIVIASVYLREGESEVRTPAVAMLLTIMPEPGWYYRLLEVVHHGAKWNATVRTGFENIVPAVEAYVAAGGDY